MVHVNKMCKMSPTGILTIFLIYIITLHIIALPAHVHEILVLIKYMHMQAVKAQTSLHKCTVSQEPTLLTYTKYQAFCKSRVCYKKKTFFIFLNQNVCCGYSKEPSQ